MYIFGNQYLVKQPLIKGYYESGCEFKIAIFILAW